MDYRIEYAMVINGPRGVEYIDNKIIDVKNKFNELAAKVALEDYLKRKYGNGFIRLEVKSCRKKPLFDFLKGFGGF